MRSRLYHEQGRWVQLDERHHISREGTGSIRNRWVFRFCDDFVSCHRNKLEAENSALLWELARTTRSTA